MWGMAHRRYVSPLRYPGGKSAMSAWLADAYRNQSSPMDVEIWIEPFAGGAGAGLTLLDRDEVDEVWLIELNPAIAAFWHVAATDTEQLAKRVEGYTPTLATYDAARALLAETDTTDRFELAMAAFIVNRCSRSGIVAPTSGPMGGRSQRGEWQLGARWNGKALAERIRQIGAFGSRLRTIHGDGISHIEELAGSGIDDEVLLFVDPPYIREGNRLYANGMDAAGHQRLADALNSSTARWILTYDDEPTVSGDLYPGRRILAYDIRNTANRARTAREYAVFSDNAIVPGGAPIRERETSWVRSAPCI